MPRQPIAAKRAAEVNEATRPPAVANTTKKLVTEVRCRVGVNSTIIVSAGTAAAVSPTPTTKRSNANSRQAPSGTKPISAAPMPQMKVPMIIWVLRPRASDRPPKISAPTMAPTPPL